MKIKCVRHNRRVFVNGEAGTIRHRSDRSDCESTTVTGIRALPTGMVMPRDKIIWLCDARMPAHYVSNHGRPFDM